MKTAFYILFISFFRFGINICSVCERSLSVRPFCCYDIQEEEILKKNNNLSAGLKECISHLQPCCISLFCLLIKPFYTDVFYLHSLWNYLHKLWSYLPRLWSLLQRLAEIKHTGRKPLIIR